MNTLDAAVAYAMRGWHVLPLHHAAAGVCSCGRGNCPSPAKHPRVAHGLKEATTDAPAIVEWWRQWPQANIGLLTGVSFDVLDVDGEEGRASLKAAVAEYGELPDGPRTRTGGGGSHLLFATMGTGNRAGVLPKVDWRGLNGYIVAPPSIHVTGLAYAWRNDETLPPPEAPGWLVGIVDPPKPIRPASDYRPLPVGAGDGTPYGLQAMTREIADLARAPEGTRNATLNETAFSLFQLVAGGEISESAANHYLRTTAAGIGLGDHEINTTLGSARSAGLAQPRSAPPLRIVTVTSTVTVTDDPLVPVEWLVPIDWPTFWAHESIEHDWLVDPLIPVGRQVAVFSVAKTGKSLLSLEVAAAKATGRATLNTPAGAAVDVVYIDMEMTEDDLRERLEALGYDGDDDMSRLHYYQLTALPPLDTDDGGDTLLAIATGHHAALVVIDTMARAVRGDENEADTYRAFYRCTGRKLKAVGIALLRLDHAGKDGVKGQRGSSAKDDDVDVVFRLTIADHEVVTLARTRSRVPWVPEIINLQRSEDDGELRHVVMGGDVYPAGTSDAAGLLDELGVALDATTRDAQTAMKRAGRGKRRDVVTAALRYRKKLSQ